MEKSYEQYSAHDFLNDPKFIRWMEGDTEEATFWENWLEDHPEKSSEIAFAQKLFSLLSSKEKEIKPRDKEALWQKIRKKSAYEQVGSDPIVSQPYPWRRILAYAAMFALLIMATLYFWPVDSTVYQTAMAEMKRVNLPDESIAILNADSKLEYLQNDSARSLMLEGEAFFDVETGRTFSVESNHGVVTVLGTSFNVLDRDSYYEVVCQSGKVSVHIKGNGSFTLTRGEYVRQNAEGRIETNDGTNDTVQVGNWTAWIEGEFFFPDTKLQRVMEEMERQFGVKIHMDEDMRELRGAFYFTNEELEQAMENVLWPLRLDYDKKGEEIYLKRQ